MGYGSAFQPLLSLLGDRVASREQASLLRQQSAAAAASRDEERGWQEGLLKRKEAAEAPERALKLLQGGMRPYQAGAMRAGDAATVGTLGSAAIADDPVGSTAGLLMRAVQPIARDRAVSTGQQDAKMTGGWIKSALSDAEQRAQEAERERRANLEFQAGEARARAEADRLSREALAREGIQSRETIAREGNQTRAALASAVQQKPVVATEGERRAAGLMTVAEEQNKIMTQMGDPSAMDRYKNMVPVVGDAMMSQGGRQFRQAAESFARSYLYIVSGANATEGETKALADQIVPSGFDDAATMKSKADRRATMLGAMRQVAGRAAPGASAAPAAIKPAPKAQSPLTPRKPPLTAFDPS
jgi:hypothetical protein